MDRGLIQGPLCGTSVLGASTGLRPKTTIPRSAGSTRNAAIAVGPSWSSNALRALHCCRSGARLDTSPACVSRWWTISAWRGALASVSPKASQEALF
jgi:hypothetical protein